jgi:hypothetical protein
VAGIYDLRAAVDPTAASGHAALVDGTIFETTLAAGAVALPASIPAAADEATLATCAACGMVDAMPGGGTRVRISTTGASDGVVTAGALTLHHHAQGPLHVRWDVVVMP